MGRRPPPPAHTSKGGGGLGVGGWVSCHLRQQAAKGRAHQSRVAVRLPGHDRAFQSATAATVRRTRNAGDRGRTASSRMITSPETPFSDCVRAWVRAGRVSGRLLRLHDRDPTTRASERARGWQRRPAPMPPLAAGSDSPRHTTGLAKSPRFLESFGKYVPRDMLQICQIALTTPPLLPIVGHSRCLGKCVPPYQLQICQITITTPFFANRKKEVGPLGPLIANSRPSGVGKTRQRPQWRCGNHSVPGSSRRCQFCAGSRKRCHIETELCSCARKQV